MPSFAREYKRNLPKALLLTALLALSMTVTYTLMNRERIFLSRTSVVVYGTESCGFTKSLRARLSQEGIAYDYGDIDIGPVSFELAAHMHMWTEARAVRLPVVLFDGRLVERPSNDEVVAAYRRLSGSQAAGN